MTTGETQRTRAARCRAIASDIENTPARAELLRLADELATEADILDGVTAASVAKMAAASDLLAHLTPRQREVLRLVVLGLRNKQIGFALGIDEKTVKMHRAAAFARLNVGSTVEAVRLVFEAGL